MKRLLQTRNKLTINKDHISRKKFRGKDHIIISGVSHMISNAVMNKIFYSHEATEILLNSLNNKRIVMPSSHPVGDSGEFISASDPLALMSNFVGAFGFNFSMRNDLLISDVAIDPEVAKREKSGEQIINAIETGEPIDISTGFFLSIEESVGVGNDGEPFDFIASDLILDHIAFLPNETGAKNKLDGVGLHVNSAIDVNGNTLDTDVVDLFSNESTPAMQLPLAPNDFVWNESAALERIKAFTNSKDKPSTNFRKFFLNFDQSNVESFDSYTNLFADVINGVPHAVRAPIESASNSTSAQAYNKRFATNKDGVFSKAWNIIKGIFANGDHGLSHSDINNKIFEKLNEGRTGDRHHLWPMEIFDTKFVYRDDNDTMFMQSYALVDDEVVFIGERTEVERVVEFKTVTNDNGDRIMRNKLIKALNAKGVKTDGLDDDAIFAAYNKLDDKDKEGLTEEEILKMKKDKDNPKNNNQNDDPVLTAINLLGVRIDKMQSDINANSDKELDDFAKQVSEMKKGIPLDVAKTMGVNACKEFLAANGVTSFNTSGGYEQQNNKEVGCSTLTLPTSAKGE